MPKLTPSTRPIAQAVRPSVQETGKPVAMTSFTERFLYLKETPKSPCSRLFM